MLMGRIELQRTAEPQLTADVTMYSTEQGGKDRPALPGYGCPCIISQKEPLEAWDGILLLRDQALLPGDIRRLGFVFLSGEEAAHDLRQAGRFYLWDGGFVGEAIVVS
jgi:hypothetical protein